MFKRITLCFLTLTILFTLVGCKGKKVTVTFDSNGGSTVETQEIKKGELATKPTDPIKEGFKFNGWFNGEKQWNFDVDKVNENITLTAKWEEEIIYNPIVYKVSFILSGGTLEEEFIEFTDYTKVVLPTPTKENYVFLGWYKGSTKFEELKENANISLTAKWEGVSSPIIYNLNGGEFTGSFKDSYKYGTAYTLPTPTKEDYNFVGWYKNADFTGTTITKIDNKTLGEVVLYAKWEAKPPVVTYVLNGGNWQWTTREEIVDEFLTDALAWAGKSNKPNGMVQGTGDTSVGFANVFSAIYGFFSDSRYAAKWGWLKDYVINATTVSGSKTYLEQGNEAYWRYSLGAFLFEECRSSYPISEDFSKDSAANGFWDTLSESEPNEFEIKAGAELKTPVRIYYVFKGWYLTEDFSGSPVTSVNEKCKLYAKWEEEVPVSSVSISNKITEIDRYETHQLEWLINPANAAIQAVEFTSSNEKIAIVSEEGLITALANGEVTITITSLSPSKVSDTVTFLVSSPDHFVVSYATDSYTTPNKAISLIAEYVTREGAREELTWSSLNSNIATVTSDGVVTGVKEGTATIRVALSKDANTYFDFVITVLNENLSNELQYIVNEHESNVFTRYELGIGAGVPVYYADIFGSVSQLLFNYEMQWDTTYLDATMKAGKWTAGLNTVEFVVVHYTAGMTKGSNAAATAAYFASGPEASAHFCTGNDGVFQGLELNVRGWHAGDGASATFEWTPTGVKYNESDPKWPTWGISSDSYFTINGQKTSVKIPKETTRGHGVDGYVTDAKWLNDQGFAFRIVNGEYQMGTTWWCYSNVWEGRICSRGGNKHGIGIESAVDFGSDLWYTWQITARLCAQLMVMYNLDITRIVGHHFFAAKDCPQPLLENDLEIWWEFIELVEAEYEAMTTYKNSTFDFEVLGETTTVNEHGRVVEQPKFSETISYKVTLSNGTSITLSSIVPGVYTK